MTDYLQTLQNVHQSIDQLLLNSQNTSETTYLTNRFSQSLQPCIDEIHQSSAKLKKLIEICLQDLQYAQVVWENRPVVLAISSSETLEEIGKLGGCSIKITKIIEQCKTSMINQLTDSWKRDFDKLNKQYFFDKEGKLKKGIGWQEKENYISGIIKSKNNQSKEFLRLIANNFESTSSKINEILDIEKFQKYLSSLDSETKKKHLKKVNLIWEELEKSLCDTQSGIALQILLSPSEKEFKNEYLQYFETKALRFKFETKALIKLDLIINRPWGDLTWEEVNKSSSAYLKTLELVISEIFDKKLEIWDIFIKTMINFYNDFLEKQKSYQVETQEQQDLKQQWLNKQRDELYMLQKSLEHILNILENR